MGGRLGHCCVAFLIGQLRYRKFAFNYVQETKQKRKEIKRITFLISRNCETEKKYCLIFESVCLDYFIKLSGRQKAGRRAVQPFRNRQRLAFVPEQCQKQGQTKVLKPTWPRLLDVCHKRAAATAASATADAAADDATALASYSVAFAGRSGNVHLIKDKN